MPIREWFQPPRRLLVLFLAVIVLPAAALGYFAWRTLEQDRTLERQRVQENLDGAAALVAAGLHQRIDRLAAELAAKPEQLVDSLPADTLIAVVKDGGVASFPKGRLLFWPPEPGVSPSPSAAFPEAEALEFRSQDCAAAAEAYGRAARSAQPGLRASALVGQARNLRKAGRVREALNVYDALGAMRDQPAGEAPAGLIARAARCGLLAQLADPLLPREASALHAELLSGRWRIDGASWEFHMGQIAQWLPPGETAEAPSAALAMAEAVATLPQLRRELKSRPDRGYRSLRVRDLPLLLAWDNQPEALTVLVGTMSLLESWEELRKHGNFSLVLTDEAGRSVWGGTEQRPGPKAFIAAADSGLPWNLRLASTEPLGDNEAFRARRGVMIGGLVVIGVLIVAGASLVARALVREMAVARMQADFVAAVSHEFRSPLTSMRHIVEMLEDGALAAESRRRRLPHQALRPARTPGPDPGPAAAGGAGRAERLPARRRRGRSLPCRGAPRRRAHRTDGARAEAAGGVHPQPRARPLAAAIARSGLGTRRAHHRPRRRQPGDELAEEDRARPGQPAVPDRSARPGLPFRRLTRDRSVTQSRLGVDTASLSCCRERRRKGGDDMKAKRIIGGAVVAVLLAAWIAFGQRTPSPEVQLKAAIHQETVDGDLKAAIEQYRRIVATPGVSRPVAAEALVRMGQCYEKLGDAQAKSAYERVVREFGDQKQYFEEAQRLLARLRSGAQSSESVTLSQERIWSNVVARRRGGATMRTEPAHCHSRT